MSDLYYERKTCRLCLSDKLQVALALEPTPMGDKYVPFERRQEFVERLPLDIMMCSECGHLQDSVVANPEILYKHYLSRPAAVNAALTGAFLDYAEDILDRFTHGQGLAVELGSNDGTFAKFLQDRGMSALGVEPALNLVEQAEQLGLHTLPTFFTSELAKRIKREHGAASAIVANHVVANIDHVADVADGVRELLAPDGIFCMQTFYLKDVLQQKLLENFNHEHISYFYIRALASFFPRHGLELIEVQHVPAKGGSIRLFVQQAGGPWPKSPSVGEMIAAEEAIGMHRRETYQAIADYIAGNRRKLHALLDPVKAEGKKVAAYGTSIGATTFTYQYGLGDVIEYYVDDDPYRQGLVSPGLHLPVRSPEVLLEEKPEYVVMMAPLYAQQIQDKNQAYMDQGGKFVLFWPEFAVKEKVAA